MLLSFLFLTVCPVAQASTENDALYEPIRDFINVRYSVIADLTEGGSYFAELSEKGSLDKALSFYQMEEILLAAEVNALKTLPESEDLRYQDYRLIIDFKDPVYNGEKEATIYTSVICKFHYEKTPSISSEYGLIYQFDLEKNDNEKWEIVSRSYPGFFEQTFWEDEAPSYETAARNASLLASLRAKSSIGEQTYTPMAEKQEEVRGQVTYSSTAKDNAAQTAIDYVAPDNYTWTSGSGYTYTYPTGYSQVKLDCTNFVSFCLNFSSGGNIPEDDTGSYKWKRNTYSWYNVDGFYSYFSATKSNTEKGFYGTTYYSGSTYPSSTVLNTTEKSDIIQFSSKSTSDWTHSAIVSSKSTSNTVYVCMHDAQGYYNEYSLSSFYSLMYPSGQPRYIRFMKIEGYYS